MLWFVFNNKRIPKFCQNEWQLMTSRAMDAYQAMINERKRLEMEAEMSR